MDNCLGTRAVGRPVETWHRRVLRDVRGTDLEGSIQGWRTLLARVTRASDSTMLDIIEKVAGLDN